MDIERCNSISTVATLPVVSTPPTVKLIVNFRTPITCTYIKVPLRHVFQFSKN